jgi:hypothetical protein
MNSCNETKEPLLNITSESEAPPVTRNNPFSLYKHIISISFSITWYYLIHTNLANNYNLNCIYLNRYMYILDTYYFLLILYQSIYFGLEWLFENDIISSENIITNLKTVGLLIFSLFGLFNLITVNYVYNFNEECSGLRTIALAWLLMVNSVATVLIVIVLIVLLYGSFKRFYKYI